MTSDPADLVASESEAGDSPSSAGRPIDWRAMFKRYAEHVGEQEGAYFLWGPGHEDAYGHVIGTQWTDEEWSAISELMEFDA